MKSIFIFICLCISLTYSFVMIEMSPPGAPANKCLSKSFNLGLMNLNDEKQVEGECMIAKCGGGGTIDYEGCSSVGLPPNCRFIEPDLTLPFPKCCKYDFICDE